MLNVQYRFGYEQSLWSVRRFHFVRISARIYEAYVLDKWSSYTRNCRGNATVTTRYIAVTRHKEDITMVEIFEEEEEKLCELRRNFKHLYDVYCLGTARLH